MLDTQPIRVLYMEDDAGAARLFQKKLQKLGYIVDLADSGDTGIAMYDAGQHDVVAVDQKMPVYDGLQVIRLLSKRAPMLPTIMITGAGDEKVAAQAIKLGAKDYIVKDVDGGYLELVPPVIEQLMEQQRLVRERQQALTALETQNRRLASLNRLSQALSASLNVEQIVRQLLTAAVETTSAEGSSVWLWADDARSWLTCKACYVRGEYFANVNLSLPATQGLIGWVATNTRSMLTQDLSDNVAVYPELNVYAYLKTHTLLAVPLLARDTTIGVLELANAPVTNSFDDQALLETLAASAAVALDNAHLVQMLRQQTLDLQIQNEDLDAFAHTVAHDLKNPISLILGYATLLEDNCNTSLDEHQCEFVRHIMKGSRKMTNIIDELLLLSEIRKVDVKPVPLNMETIVNDALARLSNMIEAEQAHIIMPPDWPMVTGYSPWIEEVWVNYLSNALKYGSKPVEMELGATVQRQGNVCLWLRNKGPELLPKVRNDLFKPFVRLKQIDAQGHGLGLSIVRRIVEKLGGEVIVDNVPNYGPIFSFSLPQPDGSQD